MNELRFQNVCKSFGAVRALGGVSFPVRQGETHALVGENGAGKSTLMKIVAGILRPDSGELIWNGQKLELETPRDALNRGIGMIYQEMVLFPNLNVSENIFAGREMIGRAGYLLQSEMRERTANLLRQLHLPFSPDDPAESLSIAHQQLLQIARSLAFDCRILILDEPTTCLTDAETADLFVILQRLRQRGVTLIYVSHKLPEVFRLCERITVLRDGQYVGTYPVQDTTPDQIVRCMVGRELEPRVTTHPAQIDSDGRLLIVDSLTRHPWFQDVSLTVHRGEIVGLFGLIGSGRSQLAETIFGIYQPDSGAITFGGKILRLRSPIDAVRAGIILVPEERHRQGLFFNLTLRENLILPLQSARRAWRIASGEEIQKSEQLLQRWRIKAAGVHAEPASLSGGNQQKVVLAKWLVTEPKVLLLDEPTKGVDIGAKYEIHELIRDQASRGAGCLLISSELPELLSLAHRIVVLREGVIQGEVDGSVATEEGVMRLATRTDADEVQL